MYIEYMDSLGCLVPLVALVAFFFNFVTFCPIMSHI